MRAAIIEKPGDIRVGTVDDPTPGRDKILLRIGASGVCGTDLHIADGEFPPTPFPIVPAIWSTAGRDTVLTDNTTEDRLLANCEVVRRG